MNTALLSLIGFSVAMYITPGPNNVMVAASAANNGIRATVPHMFGIAVGFAVMLTLVCAGLGSTLVNWPLLLPLFRWVGAAWLAVLAWQIAVAPPPAKAARRRVLGFIGRRHSSGSIPRPGSSPPAPPANTCRRTIRSSLQLARIFVVFLAVGMPCLLVWALLGSGAGRLLHSPVRLRTFNIAMALLLVASLVPVLIEG